MDELFYQEKLKKLEKVKAPPNFEDQVLSLLSTRKETKRKKARNFRLSFAGAFSVALVFFILLNVFVFRKDSTLDLADYESGVPSFNSSERVLKARDTISIIETVDYSRQMRRLSLDPNTVYILESVSNEYKKRIKF